MIESLVCARPHAVGPGARVIRTAMTKHVDHFSQSMFTVERRCTPAGPHETANSTHEILHL